MGKPVRPKRGETKSRRRLSFSEKSNRLVLISAAITFIVFIGLIVIIANKSRHEAPTVTTAELFFPNETEDFLTKQDREIPLTDDPEMKCRILVQELIKGPEGDLHPAMPEGTRLNGVNVDVAGVAFLNFNRAFVENHPGGSTAELFTVYSIVITLTQNVPEVKMLQILVEGKEIDTLAGHLNLVYPLAPKYDLVQP